MTKLQQTIKVKTDIFTGCVIPDNTTKQDLMSKRGHGKTTSYLLNAISIAMSVDGCALVFEKDVHTRTAAEYSAQKARDLIDLLKLDGFHVSVIRYDNTHGLKQVYLGVPENHNSLGVKIEFNPIKEVFYDLRK